MNRPHSISQPVVVVVLVCMTLLLGCKSQTAKEGAADAESAAPVQTETATKKDLERSITADSVLYPVRQSSITPKISAPVRHFFVNRGDHVRAGQLLAELENRDLAAAAQESRALYQQAETQYTTTSSGTLPEDATKARTDLDTATQTLDAAKRVYDNRVALVQEGALAQKLADDAKVALVQAQSQYDTTKRHFESFQTVTRDQQLKGAQDQVDAAKARLSSTQAQLSYAEVRSPMDGVVSDRPASDGEMAASGTPLITVVDVSQIVARVNLSAADSRYVKVGSPAVIHSVQGDLNGKVSVVSPSVDPATTTVEVWIKAPNKQQALKPGTTAHIEIHTETIKDAVVIPTAALLASDDGGNRVMVVGSDSTAQERKVQVGVRQGDEVQILDGVKPGEAVITVGGLGIEDKAKVQVGKGEDDKADKPDAGKGKAYGGKDAGKGAGKEDKAGK